jgi:hypothetical protein
MRVLSELDFITCIHVANGVDGLLEFSGNVLDKGRRELSVWAPPVGGVSLGSNL